MVDPDQSASRAKDWTSWLEGFLWGYLATCIALFVALQKMGVW